MSHNEQLARQTINGWIEQADSPSKVLHLKTSGITYDEALKIQADYEQAGWRVGFKWDNGSCKFVLY